jgi:hypothetical protein
MQETNDVIQDSSPEQVVAPEMEVVSEDVNTPTETVPANTVEEPKVPRSRLNEETAKRKAAEAEAKAIRERLEAIQKAKSKSLDVEDYIDISASLDGLDQREKGYLAEQHKLSGKSLKDIRNSEDFSLWQSAYRTKVEKERLTLSPSSKQSESDRPKTLTEKLKSASLADKEKLLSEAGLYKTPKQRTDVRKIG